MTGLKRGVRRGFTLVELLVVMAIIGVLMGLLLPAVQAAREAARRSSCMNNMAQLGLAMQHHDFSVEHLPSGVINPDGPIRSEGIGQHISWAVQILPFIEQRNPYEAFDFAAGSYAPENNPVRSAIIATFLCPSCPGISLNRGTNTGDSSIAESHYAGCHHNQEAPIADDNVGLLFLNSKIRYADILDGSSQTILLGELIPDTKQLGWVSGTRSTLRNTGGFGSPTSDDGRFGRPQGSLHVAGAAFGPLDVGSFGSFHTGGAQFVLADGAVKFLTNSIDSEVMKNLGNRADGTILDGNF